MGAEKTKKVQDNESKNTLSVSIILKQCKNQTSLLYTDVHMPNPSLSFPFISDKSFCN